MKKCRANVMRIGIQLILSVLTGALLLVSTSLAQSSSQGTTPSSSQAPEGIEAGGYKIHQSIEFGGRVTDVSGSAPMYDTLVNLQGGFRVFDQTLSMDSLDHSGPFDRLYLSSFGWAGDPSNAARLRISKLKWYNFNASFRRDQNYFDYNLFANPLNPPTSTPAIAIDVSPHAYYNRRRMYDFDLVLLPQNWVSFRLDYSRVRNEGPSFSSLHVGTEALLFQPTNTTTNQYRFGADVKLLPKTTLSYTQTLEYFKGDTDYSLAPFGVFPLPNGQPVNLGVTWDTVNGSPCAPVLIARAANDTCNGYFNYTRDQRARTFIPTEQLSLRSTSIKRLDLIARAEYSNANMLNPVSDSFNGLDNLFNERVATNNQSDHATWVSVTTELGATYYVTDRFRIVDTFRFNNYRVPAFATLLETNLFNAATIAPPGSLMNPPVTYPGTLPLHTSTFVSSPPDLINETFNWFLGEDSKTNETQLEYDFSTKIGARVGYRYRHREPSNRFLNTSLETFFPILSTRGDCAGVQPNPNVPCSTTVAASENNLYKIDEDTGLLGLWARPTRDLRLNANAEFMSASNFITRISPRHQQQYRADASYTPRPWVNLSGNLNILERSNHTGDINFDGHNRDYGFNAMITRSDRVGVDLAYNYVDYQQNANICYAGNPEPGSFTCINDPTIFEVLGNYQSHTHFGSASLVLKPIPRITTKLGYNITKVDGSTLILNPLQPLGPLASAFQLPMAAVAFDLAKGWTWNLGWNYYQYNEDSFVGPTLPRYFHSNLTSFSLKYEF